jgi:hypothetical protein
VTSVIAGAFAARRDTGLGVRLFAALSAGLGGALGSSLALFPARHAQLQHGDGATLAGMSIAIAAAAGVILAFVMVGARTLGWSVAATGALIWGFLGGAVAVSATDPQARLGRLSAPGLSASFEHGFGLWGLPAITALLTVIVALVARFNGHNRFAIALSGAAGPATVALAYGVAGPGVSDFQKIPWISALVAVAAGLTVSVLVALPPRGTPKQAVERREPLPHRTPMRAPIPPKDSFADLRPSREPLTTASNSHSDRSQPFVPRPLG